MTEVQLTRRGQSYSVKVAPLGAEFTFRDVNTAGELHADVSVRHGGTHLFRTTTTLSLTGRDRVAKTAAELDSGDGEGWRRATFAAVEAVLEAEEQIGAPVDLRHAPIVGSGALYAARPVWGAGPSLLVMPGEGGKSTLARAASVAIVAGREVVPGIVPAVSGPVLYVAAEAPVIESHARNVEAICRGAGLERSRLPHALTLFDARARPLHRIARAIAERAADYAAVVLDSVQALLGQGENIRDRDGLFWNAVDEIGRPTLVIAHPNRSDRKSWDRSDGSVAGSDVNRDRPRLMTGGWWRDEPAVMGTSYRRYTLRCTKISDGPRYRPFGFAASWQFGLTDDDPGTLRFTPSEPFTATDDAGLSPAMAETLEAYRDGADTVAKLREALPKLSEDAATKRLQRVRQYLGDEVPA